MKPEGFNPLLYENTKKAVAGFVMGSLDHPPGVSVNLKLVRDKMDKDTVRCGKKSSNYLINASHLQIVEKDDEWTHLGVHGDQKTSEGGPSPIYGSDEEARD